MDSSFGFAGRPRTKYQERLGMPETSGVEGDDGGPCLMEISRNLCIMYVCMYVCM